MLCFAKNQIISGTMMRLDRSYILCACFAFAGVTFDDLKDQNFALAQLFNYAKTALDAKAAAKKRRQEEEEVRDSR